MHNAHGKTIRPAFLRELLVRCDAIPNASLGVGIKNCVISGSLDISGLQYGRLLSLTGSRIEGDFIFNHADLKALFLDGTHVKKVKGVRANISTSIYLRSEMLPLKGALKTGFDDKPTLACVEKFGKVHHTVRRFVATKGVDISGAKVAGALSMRGARVGFEVKADGRPGLGLNLADADISSIILGPKDNEEAQELDEEVPLKYWPDADLKEKLTAGPKRGVNECCIEGSISFQRARCRSFTDSPSSYYDVVIEPKTHAELVLRGFSYENLGRKAKLDTKFRLDWLRADADRGGDEFDPQPFEQLASVLKAHGNERAAQTVLIDKDRRMTPFLPQKRPDWPRPLLTLWPIYLLWHAVKRILLEFIGFGYRPSLVLIPMICLFVVASLFFNIAFARGEISPVNSAVSGTAAWSECQQRKRETQIIERLISPHNEILACKRDTTALMAFSGWRTLSNYPDFNGYWYALDVLLPIISLRQEEFWAPVSQANGWGSVRSITHFFTLLGWILSSLAIAGILSFLNRSSR